MNHDQTPSLIVIGGGAMAQAIVFGAAERGILDLERCVVVDPSDDKRRLFPNAAGTADEAVNRIRAFETSQRAEILLAVKPQSLDAVAQAWSAHASGRVVISILAGTTVAKLSSAFPSATPVRVMPNTPAKIGLGMSAIARPDVPESAATARTIFGAIGDVIEIDEAIMDAFTALAGSGPAYVFYLAQAMATAGASLGLSPIDADRAARQTILGAASLLSAEPETTAEELRARVTSKGGTTAAATCVLDDVGVLAIVQRAMTAARDRGRELGAQAVS
ncbi:MAG: pyrroline-5-carboxylate reductase [Phycisphaerae bacterium]|nr:pyrroline-5-carboxylate reductase [Phycisphaerae bacterium]